MYLLDSEKSTKHSTQSNEESNTIKEVEKMRLPEFEKGRRMIPAKLQMQKELYDKTVEELREIAKDKGIETTDLTKKEIVNALSGDRGE